MLIAGAIPFAALFAIWFGYPLLIRALGAFRRLPTPSSEVLPPSVSVVLATQDRSEAIAARVADLLRTTYPVSLVEVIVALDATRAPFDVPRFHVDERGATVTVVTGDAPGGKAATLNAGVRSARNDILVFADTAQRFDPDVIGALVAQLSGERVGAVSGMLELPRGRAGGLSLADRYWLYERWLRFWESRVHSCVGVTGAIYSMRRPLWRPLPAGLILDDLYVPMRLVLDGWRIAFTPDARATDTRMFGPAQEYRRKVRTLTGVIQVCAWLPALFNPVRNPVCFQFVFHKLLRFLTPYLAAVMVLSIAWASVSLLLSMNGGVQLLVAGFVVAAALCLIPSVRRVLKLQLQWGIALQSSTVVATLNGLRGRWDVWH